MKSKKGADWVIQLVVILAILIFFFVVYNIFLYGGLRQGALNLDEQFSLAGDADNDGVTNGQDKCPCPRTGDIDDIQNEGCPTGYKITETNLGKEDRSCLIKKR